MSDPVDVGLRQQLTAIAETLVADFPELVPGSVIRCFARSVLQVRREGEPIGSVPELAHLRARVLLERRAGRAAPGLWSGELRQRSGEHDAASRRGEQDT